MAEFTITSCQGEEIAEVMAFIGTHWRAGHVLATHRGLMDWQHANANDSYNYLIARSADGIEGVLGYIPTSRYDAGLAAREMIWLALWKIRDACTIPALGLRMLGAVQKLYPNASFGVSGINPTHPPMYRALGYQAAELTQHYLTHPHKKRRLMQAPNSAPRAGNATLRELTECAALSLKDERQPHKTPAYFVQRFLQHPFYRYRVWLIGDGLMIATRLVEHDGARVLRIVDMAGDVALLAQSGTALEQLLQEQDAEYADFWQYGLDTQLLEAAGFRTVDAASGDLVPNYFEPYRLSSERILCVLKSTHPTPWLVCRADGDQDRPNLLP